MNPSPFSVRLNNAAPTLLRIGISLVFLWFGTQQILNPDQWTRVIPDFVGNNLPIALTTFVLFNGAFEIVFGTALLLGIFTRLVSGVLALHMFSIAFTLGLTPNGVRDFGLSIATTAIFLWGISRWSIDWKHKEDSQLQ